MAEDPKKPSEDLHKILEVYADTEDKVRLIILFRQNPGIIETLDGLARRLGTNADAIRDDVLAHVKLGLLKERKIGDKTVFVYNREGRSEIEQQIVERIQELMDKPEGGKPE